MRSKKTYLLWKGTVEKTFSWIMQSLIECKTHPVTRMVFTFNAHGYVYLVKLTEI